MFRPVAVAIRSSARFGGSPAENLDGCQNAVVQIARHPVRRCPGIVVASSSGRQARGQARGRGNERAGAWTGAT
jgi:hypothetical protein